MSQSLTYKSKRSRITFYNSHIRVFCLICRKWFVIPNISPNFFYPKCCQYRPYNHPLVRQKSLPWSFHVIIYDLYKLVFNLKFSSSTLIFFNAGKKIIGIFFFFQQLMNSIASGIKEPIIGFGAWLVLEVFNHSK